VAVEVGAFHGHSSVWIARALQENKSGRLFIIDDFSLGDTYERLWANLGACHVADITTVIRGNSRECPWPPKIDFAFIDGDHSHDGCKADVDKAAALGAQCIVIHDTTGWWGPRRWATEWKYDGWSKVEAIHDSGLTVMMRNQLKPPVRYGQDENPSGMLQSQRAPVQQLPHQPTPIPVSPGLTGAEGTNGLSRRTVPT